MHPTLSAPRSVRSTLVCLLAGALGGVGASPAAAAPTEIRNGLVYETGAPDASPRFPFGMFVEVDGGIDGRRAALETLGPVGIQPQWYTPGGTPETYAGTEAALERAGELGIDIAFGVNAAEGQAGNDAIFLRPEFLDSPGLFGYYHTDDAEPGGRYTPEQVRQRDADVKARDPRHVTMLSYGDGIDQPIENLRPYADGADVLMRQSFPVGHDPISTTFRQVADLTTVAAEQDTPRVPLALLADLRLGRAGRPKPRGHEADRRRTGRDELPRALCGQQGPLVLHLRAG